MTDSGASKSDSQGAAASRKRKWPWIVAAIFLALGVYNAWVTWPVHRALAEENDYSVVAYRRWLLSPTSIVVDVRGVAPSASMAGMDRNLFKAAEALKDRSYDTVVLAHGGAGKFIMSGSAFKTIGEEQSYQNPVYVVRTMQQDIKNMDGTPAFPALHGGWLGVLGAEMEQHQDLHQRWWVQDELDYR